MTDPLTPEERQAWDGYFAYYLRHVVGPVGAALRADEALAERRKRMGSEPLTAADFDAWEAEGALVDLRQQRDDLISALKVADEILERNGIVRVEVRAAIARAEATETR